MAKTQGILRHWGKRYLGYFTSSFGFPFWICHCCGGGKSSPLCPFRVATSSDWIKNQQVAVWEHALAVLNQQRSLAGTWLWLWRFKTFHIKQHIDDSLYCTVTLWWRNPSKCLKLGWDWCFCQVQKYNGWFAENPMFCSQFMDDETWSPKKDFTTNTNSPKNQVKLQWFTNLKQGYFGSSYPVTMIPERLQWGRYKTIYTQNNHQPTMMRRCLGRFAVCRVNASSFCGRILCKPLAQGWAPGAEGEHNLFANGKMTRKLWENDGKGDLNKCHLTSLSEYTVYTSIVCPAINHQGASPSCWANGCGR